MLQVGGNCIEELSLAASRRTLESFLFFYFFIASDLEARQLGHVGGGRDKIMGGVLERPAHRHSMADLNGSGSRQPYLSPYFVFGRMVTG